MTDLEFLIPDKVLWEMHIIVFKEYEVMWQFLYTWSGSQIISDRLDRQTELDKQEIKIQITYIFLISIK